MTLRPGLSMACFMIETMSSTGWQLFDGFFLAMHHQSPTDPSHQHALGLVDECNLSESDGEAGSPPFNNGHVACIVFASVCCAAHIVLGLLFLA